MALLEQLNKDMVVSMKNKDSFSLQLFYKMCVFKMNSGAKIRLFIIWQSIFHVLQR